MHDYPDEKAVDILKNIISALGYDSLILIGDMVIPATRTHWHATQVDITMMSVQLVENERWNSGMSFWGKLYSNVNQVYTYTESTCQDIRKVNPVQNYYILFLHEKNASFLLIFAKEERKKKKRKKRKTAIC